MVTFTLTANDEEKTLLGGESERNFIRLEQALGVRILTRNPNITIQADDENSVQCARAALEKIAKAVKSGQQVPEFYMEDLLAPSISQRNGGDSLPVLEKPVLIDRYGHPVQPKTRGQSKFVRMIREHDMVFAAGPAGTGKTFLAVAMAVQALEKKLVERVILCRPAV